MTGFGEDKKNKRSKNDESLARTLSEKDLIGRGLSAYQKGDLLRAKHILDKAIEVFPKSSIALGFLATIEKTLGFKERALTLFEKSISIDQSLSDILHNYSGLLEEVDIEKALEMSSKAISIAPTNSTYLERNGYLKWKSGDLLGALEASIKAIELNPNLIDAYINISGIQMDLETLTRLLPPFSNP